MYIYTYLSTVTYVHMGSEFFSSEKKPKNSEDWEYSWHFWFQNRKCFLHNETLEETKWHFSQAIPDHVMIVLIIYSDFCILCVIIYIIISAKWQWAEHSKQNKKYHFGNNGTFNISKMLHLVIWVIVFTEKPSLLLLSVCISRCTNKRPCRPLYSLQERSN